MSVAPIRRPRADQEALALLRQMLDVMLDIRGELRRQRAAPALVEALRNAFVEGASRFTAQGVLDLAAEDVHGELASALSEAHWITRLTCSAPHTFQKKLKR